MQRKVLGKGLDALIPKKDVSVPTKEFTYLPLEIIKTSAYQPRQKMDRKEVDELSQSIKEKGFIQPIVVRPHHEGYELVAGGRRLYAAKLLGLKEIPALIKELDDKDTFTLAIVENLQRKDLNPIEEAEAFQHLINQFSYTLADVARFVSKDKTTVANTLRLLRLPAEIQDALKKGIVSRSQARTILALENPTEQIRLFEDILKEPVSVREIETRVKKGSRKKKAHDPFILEVEELLQKALGTKVRILNKKNNRGRIVIEYYSLEDLDRIGERLGIR